MREARVYSSTKISSPESEIDVRASHPQAWRRSVLSPQRTLHSAGLGRRKQGISECTRFLDVLHDAADQHLAAVTDGVHVDLGGVRQEPIQEHRCIVRDRHGPPDIGRKVLIVIDDLHGPAAQDIGRADHQRIADLVGQPDRPRRLGNGAVLRLPQPSRSQRRKRSPSAKDRCIGGVPRSHSADSGRVRDGAGSAAECPITRSAVPGDDLEDTSKVTGSKYSFPRMS